MQGCKVFNPGAVLQGNEYTWGPTAPQLQTVKREYGRSWKFPLVVNMPSGNHCSCVCTAALQQTQPADGGRQSATRPCVCVCTVYYTCGWFVALRMRAHRSARSPVGQPCLLYCCAAALSSSITTTQETWRQNREWVHNTAVIHLRTRLPSPGYSPRNIQKEGLKKIHEVEKKKSQIWLTVTHFWHLTD